MADLRDLGLSEYEARAYRALLRTGPATAKELSRTSEVPMGRVYDVLNGLEGDGLVRSQADSRPKRYAAVEPEAALDRLVERRRRELEERAAEYERAAGELVGELEATEPPEEEFWTAAVGGSEALDLVAERIAAAERRLAVVAGDSAAAFDLAAVGGRIADALVAALDRGVSVRVLLSPAVLDALPDVAVRTDDGRLTDRESFHVRTGPADRTFGLIDGVEVCVEVPHPLAAGEPFAAIDLKDAEFAADVDRAFDDRWADAEPAPTGGGSG